MKAIVAVEQQQHTGGNARTDFLNPGGKLNKGDRLTSPNGLFYLLFDSDGKLKLYDYNGTKYWDNGVSCKPGYAQLATNGHLHVIDHSGDRKWDSKNSGGGTWGDNQAGFITMQNNGNLVIYDTQGNSVTWQTNTVRPTPTLTRNVLYPGDYLDPGDILLSENKFFMLIYQAEGPYKGDVQWLDWQGNILWHTNTAGNTLGRFLMQTDGNLCLYDKNKRFLWGSHQSLNTALTAGNFLKAQTDGNLCIYPKSGPNALWCSGTTKALPGTSSQMAVTTTAQCGVVVALNGGASAASVCGGVITGTSGCGAVMSGFGACGVVYSGASFCGAVANAVSACAADIATFGVCAAVAAASGASVVSISAIGGCGAVATIAGVCGAVVAAAGASAISASGTAACGAVACGAAACGADASGTGACIETTGAGACGANATVAQGTGVCGAQVGFCAAVLCVAIPIGGNW